jgi:hypothetical protein
MHNSSGLRSVCNPPSADATRRSSTFLSAPHVPETIFHLSRFSPHLPETNLRPRSSSPDLAETNFSLGTRSPRDAETKFRPGSCSPGRPETKFCVVFVLRSGILVPPAPGESSPITGLPKCLFPFPAREGKRACHAPRLLSKTRSGCTLLDQ